GVMDDQERRLQRPRPVQPEQRLERLLRTSLGRRDEAPLLAPIDRPGCGREDHRCSAEHSPLDADAACRLHLSRPRVRLPREYVPPPAGGPWTAAFVTNVSAAWADGQPPPIGIGVR